MAKKDRLRAMRIERRDLHDRVINYFNTEAAESGCNYKQVSAAVGATTPRARTLIVEILEQLATDGFLAEISQGRYRVARRSMVAEGVFIRRSNGKNSVDIGADDGEPIMVAERNSMHALNGDRVMVHIGAVRPGMQPEAEVVQIIERKPQTFTGTLQVKKYFAHLTSDSKFLATDIFIPLDKLQHAQTGDKVVVRIMEWPQDANSPIGEVVDVLGPAGDNNAEIHAILAEFGLPYKYPTNVERAAERISDAITDEDLAARRDLRGVTTFTIDPDDAKDFDDALSIRALPGGNWEVGVHIADVTHYVRPGTVIDKEARERATSVYLVDRTIPMLPERLCNHICSLRPDEDKLTHSVIFELTPSATVKRYEICHTVTRSVCRMSYEQAQEVIERGEGPLASELLTLNDLAQKLRKRRFDAGAVAFDRTELKFRIDEQGRPVEVLQHVSREANKLIEEFMLLANRTVAEHIGRPLGKSKAKAFVYRIHGEPDREKLTTFGDIATHLGYKVKVSGSRREVNRSINRLLEKVKGTPHQELLSILAIRSMAKAAYSADNIGHYGLAFDYYTHFTSPIRRYPDMMVHRLLDRYAQRGSRSVGLDELEELCQHMSAQESLATMAERNSIKYKAVEFMGQRLGEVFKGHISGVTEWGLYVEADETHCEGMVSIRDLDDDYYEFDEKNYLVRGRRTRRTYQLGDEVTIQVARADLIRKQLDYVLVTKTRPAFSHRIDQQPITEQNSGVLARMAKQTEQVGSKRKKGSRKAEQQRERHEGISRRGQRRKMKQQPSAAAQRKANRNHKKKAKKSGNQ